MKKFILVSLSTLLIINIRAQHQLSIDLAAVRNTSFHINGANISLFYHFNEKMAFGVEMNRFFETHIPGREENVKNSAWDFDYNFHYNIPLLKKVTCYFVTGVSHTSELEKIQLLNNTENIKTKFWSYNYGLGFYHTIGKLSSYAEYLFTNSFHKVEGNYHHQQFLLAGISYEFQIGKHKHHMKS